MDPGLVRVGARHAVERRRPGTLVLGIVIALCLCTGGAGAAGLEHAREVAREGRAQDALAEVDQVLAERPDDVEALLLRGVLLSQLGDSDAAIEVFNDIARVRPDLPEPHNNLAVLYAAQGRYERARDALLEAVRLQPDYDLAHENLGDVYAKLAALSYARANQVNPDNEGAARKAAAAEDLITAGGRRRAAASSTARPAATRRVGPAAAAAGDRPITPCVTLGGIRPAERGEGVAAWFRDRGLQAAVREETLATTVPRDYRVYLPPLANRGAANQRIKELRAAGVKDLIIISDGAQRNGISLGVFARRASADRRVHDLAALGVEPQIEERGERSVASARVEVIGEFSPAAFARAFPDLPFSPKSCE